MSKAFKLRVALADLNSPQDGLTVAIRCAEEAIADVIPIVESAERDREDLHNVFRAALLEDNAPDLVARLSAYVVSHRTRLVV